MAHLEQYAHCKKVYCCFNQNSVVLTKKNFNQFLVKTTVHFLQCMAIIIKALMECILSSASVCMARPSSYMLMYVWQCLHLEQKMYVWQGLDGVHVPEHDLDNISCT